MFYYTTSQVVAFVKGIKVAGRNPALLHDAYDSVVSSTHSTRELTEYPY